MDKPCEVVNAIDPSKVVCMTCGVSWDRSLNVTGCTKSLYDNTNAESVSNKRALLEDAILAVSGERALNYGKPEDNFKRIADLWNTWFEINPRSHPRVTPSDVAILCILLKIARLANEPRHRDSWLDIAGYAACGSDITEGLK